ncbi:hypothetical protein SAMN05216229_101303 [Geopseudomonas sagittaria]|uniref:SPOR domain-containing protein n=1 Tax=Geopseudomonas sagittaria TaxID=1135990 RepID=A0A1I5P3E0_9GAMM|nr:hypothetical protein [Pseudomonas sagittaria]MCM2329865.1 hypothetical protein [Pseudomonas sagittaria]SFP28569.1 hypothetical protein SAMN05216229_101303 [Pseudomonas sagittaria]
MTRSTDSGAQPGRWLLYRIDDNGNEVAMRRFAKRADAEAAMRDYEARGHKQAYLVREERGPPSP